MEFDDPACAAARFRLEQARILLADGMRKRREALLCGGLVTAALLVILAVSFPFLVKRGVSARGELLLVCALGGCVGGAFVCLGELARLMNATARNLLTLPDSYAYYLLVKLPVGAAGGAAAWTVVSVLTDTASFRPQTIFFFGVAAGTLLARKTPLLFTALELTSTDLPSTLSRKPSDDR